MFIVAHSSSWFDDCFANTILPEIMSCFLLLHLDCIFKCKKKPLKTCTIGLGLAFIPICSDIILEKLSDAFSNTYFIIESFTRSAGEDFYKNFDISIVAVSNDIEDELIKTIKEPYSIKAICEYPLYTWISTNSALNQKSVLNLPDLKNYTFSVLRNFYNAIDFLNSFTLKNVQEVTVKKNFIDYIEKFDCYTLDQPFNYGNFIYEDVFRGCNVCKKITNSSSIANIIYRGAAVEDFCQIISSVFPH